MSRRKKHNNGPQPADQQDASATSDSAAAAADGRGQVLPTGPQFTPKLSRQILYCCVAITLVWMLALISLAVTTANPVTLNQLQILQADYVVAATIVDLKSGRVKVQSEFKQNAPLEAIRIANLETARARAGESYLIPISKSAVPFNAGKLDETYRVTPTQLPTHLPLIYPHTPAAEQQLRAILAKQPN